MDFRILKIASQPFDQVVKTWPCLCWNSCVWCLVVLLSSAFLLMQIQGGGAEGAKWLGSCS